jgi:hypothetical protein
MWHGLAAFSALKLFRTWNETYPGALGFLCDRTPGAGQTDGSLHTSYRAETERRMPDSILLNAYLTVGLPLYATENLVAWAHASGQKRKESSFFK